jgi:hypothetical protein
VSLESLIKSLERMGYDVVNNTKHAYIMVMLRTRNDYACYYSLSYDELENELILEYIVDNMNARIKEDL